MPVLRAQTCKCQLERTEAEDTGQWRVEHHKLFFLENLCTENRQQYSPKMAKRRNNIINYLCLHLY